MLPRIAVMVLALSFLVAPAALAEDAVTSPPVPSARPDGTVDVSFQGEKDETLWIVIGHKLCQVPCSLSLAPGQYELGTAGARTMNLQLRVPHASGVVHLPTQNRALLISGIVLTIVGALLEATLFLAIDASCAPRHPMIDPDFGCIFLGDILGPTVPFPVLITGIALLGAWGAQRPTSAAVEVTSREPDASPFKLAAVGLVPMRNGLGAGLGFSF